MWLAKGCSQTAAVPCEGSAGQSVQSPANSIPAGGSWCVHTSSQMWGPPGRVQKLPMMPNQAINGDFLGGDFERAAVVTVQHGLRGDCSSNLIRHLGASVTGCRQGISYFDQQIIAFL